MKVTIKFNIEKYGQPFCVAFFFFFFFVFFFGGGGGGGVGGSRGLIANIPLQRKISGQRNSRSV